MLIEFGYERRACYICNIKNRLDEYLTEVTDVNVFLIRILSLIVLIGNAIPCMEIVDLFLMQGFLCFCVSLLRYVTKIRRHSTSYG